MESNIVCIQALLESNADVTIQNNCGEKVLHLACKYELEKCIQILLDSNIDINAVDKYGRTALHTAVKTENDKIVELILKKNPNMEQECNSGEPALHLAIKLKCPSIVELLIKNGADVNAAGRYRTPALYWALSLRSLRIIELLLINKADVNCKFEPGGNILHHALEMYNLPTEIIEFILNFIDDINAKNYCGKTVIHIAAENQNIQTLKYLLKNNADVNVKDSRGRTALYSPMIWRYPPETSIECIKILVEYNADINTVDNDLISPLHLTCSMKNTEVFHYLMQKGANFRMKDKYGRTVFHYACMNAEETMTLPLIDDVTKALTEDILNALIEKNISVNCSDKFGQTPLHDAVKMYNSSCIYQLFLNIGADINIVDENGKLPFDKFVEAEYFSENKKTKPYIQHVIKMKVMGMWVQNKTLDRVYKKYNGEYWKWIHDYEGECNKEIDLMKITYIDQSNLTYYNFLKKSVHDVINFTRNQHLVDAIKSGELIDMFPIYGHFLKCQLREAQRRSHLCESIEKSLRQYDIFEKLPTDCMNEIFKYLDNSELMTLLEEMCLIVPIESL